VPFTGSVPREVKSTLKTRYKDKGPRYKGSARDALRAERGQRGAREWTWMVWVLKTNSRPTPLAGWPTAGLQSLGRGANDWPVNRPRPGCGQGEFVNCFQ
jgi:hypothetical protein